jgi:methionine-rich copper-binding protein CopC
MALRRVVERASTLAAMTPRRLGRRAVAVALFVLLVASTPPAVLGHAELATVSPADTSTVQGSPDEIVMTFTQNLDPAKSSIRLVDAVGKVIVEGSTVAAGRPRELDLVVPVPLAPGVYTIRWTSFSTEDGEQARGTTTFTVAAAPTPSPTPLPTPSAAAPSVSPSVAPSLAPTVAPSPSPPPTAPAASTGDALVPIVFALLVLAGLGLWLLRGRSRARR